MFSLPDYRDVQVIDYWADIEEHAKRRNLIIVIDEFEGFTVRKSAPEGSHLSSHTVLGKCTTLGELEMIIREDEIPGMRDPLDA